MKVLAFLIGALTLSSIDIQISKASGNLPEVFSGEITYDCEAKNPEDLISRIEVKSMIGADQSARTEMTVIRRDGSNSFSATSEKTVERGTDQSAVDFERLVFAASRNKSLTILFPLGTSEGIGIFRFGARTVELKCTKTLATDTHSK